jgi:cytochrome b subunit of formate dehydrogenase
MAARMKRYIYYRDALEAVKRLRVTSEGRRYVVRFPLAQRIEHFILILSFFALAITGLAQTYYNTLAGDFTLNALGGIESSRLIHHFAAFSFGILALYHVAIFVDEVFVHRRFGKIFPAWRDVTDAIQMIKFNLGFAVRRPLFDRYNFEEKAEYWALVSGMIIMGVTGIMQWFPVQLTLILPAGWIIPVSRVIHRWQAILMVIAILTWHFYNTVIKKMNLSIFNGNMTIENMKEDHPIELACLEQASAVIQNKRWPLEIEILLEDVNKNIGPEQAVHAEEETVEEVVLEENTEGSIQ